MGKTSINTDGSTETLREFLSRQIELQKIKKLILGNSETEYVFEDNLVYRKQVILVMPTTFFWGSFDQQQTQATW